MTLSAGCSPSHTPVFCGAPPALSQLAATANADVSSLVQLALQQWDAQGRGLPSLLGFGSGSASPSRAANSSPSGQRRHSPEAPVPRHLDTHEETRALAINDARPSTPGGGGSCSSDGACSSSGNGIRRSSGGSGTTGVLPLYVTAGRAAAARSDHAAGVGAGATEITAARLNPEASSLGDRAGYGPAGTGLQEEASLGSLGDYLWDSSAAVAAAGAAVSTKPVAIAAAGGGAGGVVVSAERAAASDGGSGPPSPAAFFHSAGSSAASPTSSRRSSFAAEGACGYAGTGAEAGAGDSADGKAAVGWSPPSSHLQPLGGRSEGGSAAAALQTDGSAGGGWGPHSSDRRRRRRLSQLSSQLSALCLEQEAAGRAVPAAEVPATEGAGGSSSGELHHTSSSCATSGLVILVHAVEAVSAGGARASPALDPAVSQPSPGGVAVKKPVPAGAAVEECTSASWGPEGGSVTAAQEEEEEEGADAGGVGSAAAETPGDIIKQQQQQQPRSQQRERSQALQTAPQQSRAQAQAQAPGLGLFDVLRTLPPQTVWEHLLRRLGTHEWSALRLLSREWDAQVREGEGDNSEPSP